MKTEKDKYEVYLEGLYKDGRKIVSDGAAVSMENGVNAFKASGRKNAAAVFNGDKSIDEAVNDTVEQTGQTVINTAREEIVGKGAAYAREEFDRQVARAKVHTGHIAGRTTSRVIRNTAEVVGKHGEYGKQAGKYLKSINKDASKLVANGTAAAVEQGLVGLTISGVNNVLAVSRGEKTAGEAAADTLQDGGAAVIYSAKDTLMHEGKDFVVKQAREQLPKALVNITPTKEIAKIGAKMTKQFAGKAALPVVTMAVSAAVSVYKYVNGEISARDAAQEIVKTGITAYAMEVVGGVLAGPVGVVAVGVAVVVIEQAVAICKQVMAENKEAVENREAYIAEFNRLADEAAGALNEQKIILQELFDKNNQQLRTAVDSGFEQIIAASVNNDAEGIAAGLDKLLVPFNGKCEFATVDEFQTFFNDTEAVLKL